MTDTQVKPRQVRLFIAGRWVDAKDGKTFQQVSPATGDVIGFVAEASREDAQAAVASASEARRLMARPSVFEWARFFHQNGDAIVGRQARLAPELSLEQGQPRP